MIFVAKILPNGLIFLVILIRIMSLHRMYYKQVVNNKTSKLFVKAISGKKPLFLLSNTWALIKLSKTYLSTPPK